MSLKQRAINRRRFLESSATFLYLASRSSGSWATPEDSAMNQDDLGSTKEDNADPNAIDKQLVDLISQYGTVERQIRKDAPHQIYVVAQKHENLDGTIDDDVPSIQMRIFRIGQLLVDNYKVPLILPEGFYETMEYSDANEAARSDKAMCDYIRSGASDDDIVEVIRDDHTINSAMLLQFGTSANVQGAENPIVHSKVYEGAKRGLAGHSPEWEYTVDLRTGILLVNTPKVAVREAKAGRIPNLNAMSIMGRTHISKLIDFVENDRISIEGLQESGFASINIPLRYEKMGFGVTVIVPHYEAETID